MKSGRLQTLLMSLPCAAAFLIGPTAAQAATIDLTSAGCTGASCGPIAFAGGSLSLTAVGGNFQYKTLNGETGLGVSGGTAGEIDVNEAIDGTFSSPVGLDAFRIVFIYNGPEFGDPMEIARLSVNGGAVFGTLQVIGENTAVWSLGGSVSSCGATDTNGTGCFEVSNPFGSTAISSFSFTASTAPGGTNDSDFSLGSLTVSSVPEPASMLLFGTALLGYAARRRRTA